MRHTVPAKRVYPPLPQPSPDRLDASWGDESLGSEQLAASLDPGVQEKVTTVLYLAYGSNLCNETFRGVRGIRPLSQINVVVPSLRLTFNLPGIPYSEPCFANTKRRPPDAPRDNDNEEYAAAAAASGQAAASSGYHKDHWTKGLVGVVYEVTRSDYAHIIATEGGGSAYSDILVDCYVLPAADTVPTLPDTRPFKAHTLFAPLLNDQGKQSTTYCIFRPDPSYAQPSMRYLGLILNGAAECQLPKEYQEYLHNIRPYKITSNRQWAGKVLFLANWLPFIMLIFSLERLVKDKKERVPGWFARLRAWVFLSMWASYDNAFKGVFGDGERTVGDGAPW